MLVISASAMACAISITLAVADTIDNVAPNSPGNQKVVYKKLSESELRFANTVHLIAIKCMTCHKAGGSALDFSPYFASEASWVSANLIIPKQSQNSLFFKYLIGSGFNSPPLGTMPLGGTLSAAELEIFRKWIDEMIDPSTIPTPTPTATPISSVAPVPFGLEPSQAAPHLGDRAFVKSVLDRVFGPAAATTTTTLVNKYISIFGGTYDVMTAPPASGQANDSCPTSDCDAQVFVASTVPYSSTTRAGQTIKVCNVLGFNDTTLQYAIKAATNKTDLNYLKTDPIPTLNEIIAAYALFGPELGSPSVAAIGQLTTLAQTAKVANYPTCPTSNPNCQFDPWRYVILALCYDPAWQVS